MIKTPAKDPKMMPAFKPMLSPESAGADEAVGGGAAGAVALT